MKNVVTLSPSNTAFSVEANETIFAAAKQQGLNLPHSCQNGICGQCKAEVLSGEVIQGEHTEQALSASERSAGKILMCCSTMRSDVALNIPAYTGADTPPVKTLPSRISSIEIMHDIAIIKLALPKASPFVFWAGQYIDLLLPDNRTRSYSIANSPTQTSLLELHVRYRKGGLFSEMLFSGSLKEKAILRIRAPLGTFTLNESNAPIILMATGTGFAPMQSLLQHLIDTNSKRTVHLYWGARQIDDLYAQQTAHALIQALPNARLTLVLSKPHSEWCGAAGYVQDHITQDYPDLSAYEVYACGSSDMIESAQIVLHEHCNLPNGSFFSDAFSPAQ